MTYQIQIALKGSRPKIWRRVLVPSSITLSDMHKIIQTTMGWTNGHMHQFEKDRTFYSPQEEQDFLGVEFDDEEYSVVKLSELLKKEKDKMTYEYDFGDGWMHNIILEKVHKSDKNQILPICLTGKNSCPPEDCGGVMQYVHMIRVLKDPDHEQYEEYKDWLGDAFDPKQFDKDHINEMLQSENYGCFEMF